MKIHRNKSFPYPVLCAVNDDYTLGKFNSCDIRMKVSPDTARIVLSANVAVLESPSLDALIEAEQATYCLLAKCPRTFFRAAYQSSSGEFELFFDGGKLDGEVEIAPFVVTCERIVGYKNPHFHEEYNEYSDSGFDVTRGSVLAYGTPVLYFVDTAMFKFIGSVFRVEEDSEVGDDVFHFNAQGEYIRIFLSPRSYASFNKIRQNNNVRSLDTFLSGVYLPVLTSVLHELDMDVTELGERRWARAIRRRYSELGLQQPSESHRGNRLDDAQAILKGPFGKILVPRGDTS